MNAKPKVLLTDITGTISHNDTVKQLYPDFLSYTNPQKLADLDTRLNAFPEQKALLASVVRSVIAAGHASDLPGAFQYMHDHTKAAEATRSFDTNYLAAMGVANAISYMTGQLQGHFFDDVIPAFVNLSAKGVPVFTYSAGSEFFQGAMFAHSPFGNMRHLVKGFFDTAVVGGKAKPDSYKRIADTLQVGTDAILFTTDLTKEADPAYEAGCNISLVVRPGNKPQEMKPNVDYKVITTFADITSRF